MEELLRASLLAVLSKLFLRAWLRVGMALDPAPGLVDQLAHCVCALILFSAKAEPKTRTLSRQFIWEVIKEQEESYRSREWGK